MGAMDHSHSAFSEAGDCAFTFKFTRFQHIPSYIHGSGTKCYEPVPEHQVQKVPVFIAIQLSYQPWISFQLSNLSDKLMPKDTIRTYTTCNKLNLTIRPVGGMKAISAQYSGIVIP
jgi:hypothetical protein